MHSYVAVDPTGYHADDNLGAMAGPIQFGATSTVWFRATVDVDQRTRRAAIRNVRRVPGGALTA